MNTEHERTTACPTCQQIIPGGVNSRSAPFAVGESPPLYHHGEGCRFFDVDGNAIDYVLLLGPLILGHRFPAVLDTIGEVLEVGTSFRAPTEHEILLAEALQDAVPSLELVGWSAPAPKRR